MREAQCSSGRPAAWAVAAAILSAVLASAGCATVHAPKGAITDVPLEQAMTSASELLTERGMYIKGTDGRTLTVTEWYEDFAHSEIAGLWTRYIVLGDKPWPGENRIRFFRQQGTAAWQTDATAVERFEGNTALPQANIDMQGSHSPAEKAQASVFKDLETEDTFTPRPKTITTVRDAKLEEALQARLQKRDEPAPQPAATAAPPPEPATADSADAEAAEPAEPADAEAPLWTQLCGPPVHGWDELQHPERIVLIGEIPGTTELPELLGRIVCHAAVRGLPVIVGLEVPLDEQPRLSSGKDVIDGAFWHRPFQDGRSSEAVLELIHRLHALRAQGFDVRTVALDHPWLNGVERSVALAAPLLKARQAHPGAVTVALVGNAHVPVTSPKAPKTMADALEGEGERVVALTLAYDSYEAWTCREGLKCGLERNFAGREEQNIWRFRPLGGTRPVSPGFILRPLRIDGVDGLLFVHELHSSPPADPHLREVQSPP